MIDCLLKVTFPVKQADPCETDSQIAGRLGVVAGQDAKPACGNRQGLVESEFGRKVGDRVRGQGRRMPRAPRVRLLHIGIEGLDHLAHAPGEVRVIKTHVQFVVGNFLQDGHGIVIKGLPAPGRKLVENLLGFLIPGPPEITSQLLQSCGQCVQLFG